MKKEQRTKYPDTLYVKEDPLPYPMHEVSQMVGSDYLEARVADNGEWNVIAIYQLVEVARFKKTVTRTAAIEKDE